MDEALTRVALDISNRPYLIWKVAFSRPKLGEMDTELFKEWFQAFAQNAGITLHVENLYGENNHHIVETRSEEHTSELQSLMRISYAVFCLKKKKEQIHSTHYLNKTNTEFTLHHPTKT